MQSAIPVNKLFFHSTLSCCSINAFLISPYCSLSLSPSLSIGKQYFQWWEAVKEEEQDVVAAAAAAVIPELQPIRPELEWDSTQ